MIKRELGKTGIKISECGYGCAALFGKNVLGKEGISDKQAYKLIITALEKGINFFDTGFNYGYAEERLGKCLRRAFKEGIVKREDVVIETKCGETLNDDGSYGDFDWSSDWIKKSVEISLKRLNLEYIDMLAIHGGDNNICTDEFIKTFEDLKSQGIIKSYGANTFDTDFLKWICKEKCFDYVMLDYNIMKQEREILIRALYDNEIGVLAGAALGQSLFSKRKIRNRNDLWYFLRSVVNFKAMRKKGKSFEFLNHYSGYTANQLALRYVLDNQYISSAVFNTTNVDHLTENLRATEITLPDNIRKRIISQR